MWQGSIFDCENDEILLRHNSFDDPAVRECNHGAITAHSISATNDYYTSQLNITVSQDMSGKSIICVYNNGFNETDTGRKVLTLTTGILSTSN